MRFIAVFLIVLYQRYISPYKGFRCAHALRNAGPSCSAAVRDIVERDGLWRGWPQIRRRFAECRAAARELQEEREERKRRRRRQAEDCDWCDVGCLPLDVAECADCSAVDCGGADCGAPDCSALWLGFRPNRGRHPAQGS